MNVLTILALASTSEQLMPDNMRKDMERRIKQLSKPLKTCKCGKGFNHRGYMCRECFDGGENANKA